MIALATIFEALNAIPGFTGKVVYDAWEEGQAPELPVICYNVTGSANFYADGGVYVPIDQLNVELFTRRKDPQTEKLMEDKFEALGMAWAKNEDYDDSEKVYIITYEIEV